MYKNAFKISLCSSHQILSELCAVERATVADFAQTVIAWIFAR